VTPLRAREPYRAALIGCGKIGSTFADDPLMRGDVFTHAEAYSTCPDTELTAIADSDPAALERCGSRWGVDARFATATALMSAVHPEIVSVATPTGTHFDTLRTILDCATPPRAVLSEKPLATTEAEGREVVELARARGVLLVVMHMRRYAQNMQRLRKFIDAGGLGDLRGVTGWLTRGTTHNGTHWFDLLRYLVGEVDWVRGENTLGEPGDDPTLDVTMGLTSGRLATMRAAEVANFTICEMDIMGSRGRARIVDSSYQIDIFRAVASPRYTGYVELVPEPADFGDRRNVMLHAVEDIVRCLDTGSAPLSSGEDGLAALRIALAAHESARTGRRISLDARPAGGLTQTA
jgi:Predicted dehydrogenases and related proteins